jgi:hypothetical protein
MGNDMIENPKSLFSGFIFGSVPKQRLSLQRTILASGICIGARTRDVTGLCTIVANIQLAERFAGEE